MIANIEQMMLQLVQVSFLVTMACMTLSICQLYQIQHCCDKLLIQR